MKLDYTVYNVIYDRVKKKHAVLSPTATWDRLVYLDDKEAQSLCIQLSKFWDHCKIDPIVEVCQFLPMNLTVEKKHVPDLIRKLHKSINRDFPDAPEPLI